jgi:acylglycerol lipase
MAEKRMRTELPPAQGGVIDLISGHPLFARAWRGRGHRGVVICVHGAESHSGWFCGLAQELQEVELDAFAYDRMGWGQSPGDNGELTSLHDIYDELCSLIYILRERYDRIHLLGMSWGGLYALYAAYHLLPIVNTISILSPGLFLRNPFNRKTLRTAFDELFKNRRWRFSLAYEPQDFSSEKSQKKFIEDDPWRQKTVGPRFVAATLMMQSVIKSPLFKRPNKNVQVLIGDKDRMIWTQKTVDFCENLDITCRTILGGHSLVLDNPLEVVKHLARIDAEKNDEEPMEFRKAH